MFQDLILRFSKPLLRNLITTLATSLAAYGVLKVGDDTQRFIDTFLALALWGVGYALSKYNEAHKEKVATKIAEISLRTPPPPVITTAHIEEIKARAEIQAKPL